MICLFTIVWIIMKQLLKSAIRIEKKLDELLKLIDVLNPEKIGWAISR